MQRYAMYGLLFLLCICLLSLVGCSSRLTTLSGDPYTADDVKAMVEKHFETYHPCLVLQSSKVITTKPYKHNEYTFLDENNGFVFSARASVEVPQLPIPVDNGLQQLIRDMQKRI